MHRSCGWVTATRSGDVIHPHCDALGLGTRLEEKGGGGGWGDMVTKIWEGGDGGGWGDMVTKIWEGGGWGGMGGYGHKKYGCNNNNCIQGVPQSTKNLFLTSCREISDCFHKFMIKIHLQIANLKLSSY